MAAIFSDLTVPAVIHAISMLPIFSSVQRRIQLIIHHLHLDLTFVDHCLPVKFTGPLSEMTVSICAVQCLRIPAIYVTLFHAATIGPIHRTLELEQWNQCVLVGMGLLDIPASEVDLCQLTDRKSVV